MRYSSIFVFFLLFSCDSSRIYEDYVDFENAFWHIDSVKTFSFQIEDTTHKYNLYATIRNASSYPFYNLYYQFQLTDAQDSIITEALKESNLFNPKTGKPYGSGLGDLFDHSFLLDEGTTFPRSGNYKIKLQQSMRKDTLPFILSVGVKVAFADKKQ